MTQVCKKCGYLMPEGIENHQCPSKEYTELVKDLIHEAAIYDEMTPEEDK